MKQALHIPLDVKLMNFIASAMLVGCIGVVLGALLMWVLGHPLFAIKRIEVDGELVQLNQQILRSHVAQRIEGNFLTIDLPKVQATFESVPWVRSAMVRRVLPLQLQVTLQEHVPVAYWGLEEELVMLNQAGEIFEVGNDEASGADMPHLAGPKEKSQEVLAMYQQLNPLFAPLDMSIVALVLSERGSWQVELDGGAQVQLGSGSAVEVVQRSRQFIRTVNQIAAKYGRKPDALESADLRHQDGYAVRLRGVTTVSEKPTQ